MPPKPKVGADFTGKETILLLNTRGTTCKAAIWEQERQPHMYHTADKVIKKVISLKW